MAEKRFRIQYKFWLDVTQDEQFDLAETINELKQARSFSRVVRDGIRLVVDLWQGRVEVLLALFPWVEDYFFQRFSELQPTTDQDIAQQLTKLEQLLVEQGSVPLAAAPKPLSVPVIPAPVFDDDNDLLVVTKAKSSDQAAQNFLDSAFALVN